MFRFLTIFVVLFFVSISVYAATQGSDGEMSGTTNIAPAYFGPNAFPIIDMSDGTTSEKLVLELAADHYWGKTMGNSSDIFARIKVPLFTPRVNLTVWMAVVEFYRPDYMAETHINADHSANDLHYVFGDVYLSTDVMVCRERKYCPSMVIRAGVKTASGGGFPDKRYYDSPGYFFDYTVGKQFAFKSEFAQSIRIAATIGFLCWQTDNGRQNDAIMYGVLLNFKSKYFVIEETFSGYYGWENDGDRPMSIKSKLSYPIKDFEPYIYYQYGIKDYPYHQLRVGLAYNLKLPALRKKTQ